MEWDSNPRLRRDWCLKPAPWTARPSNQCRPPPPRARRAVCLEGKTKSLRRPGIKPGSRPWQGRILSLYYRRAPLSIPRLELGTSRVLGERHNQLDHTDGGKTKNGVSGFRSQYLVLAKDARFRLRQYPAARLNGVSGFRSQYLVLAKHARFRLRQYPDGKRGRGGQAATGV